MKTKKNIYQSIIVCLIVLIIFTYISIDLFTIKPQIRNELNNIKSQYTELSDYLNYKMPKIDSTFQIHTKQIEIQKNQIDTLNIVFKKLNLSK
jgi:predicted PurR-regulated permease PerM